MEVSLLYEWARRLAHELIERHLESFTEEFMGLSQADARPILSREASS